MDEREREREERRNDAAFRRIVLLKETNAKAHSLFVVLLLLSILLYILLSPSLPPAIVQSLSVYVRPVAHWKIYAVNYRPGSPRSREWNRGHRGNSSPEVARCLFVFLSVLRAAADPLSFSVCQVFVGFSLRENIQNFADVNREMYI